MKISCQSCQAKYTIADEKVLGKIVKIRCKKCGATIVINGNEGAQAGGGSGEAPAFDYNAPAGDQWTVNVADGDQRSMTHDEIVGAYRTGVVTDETYCWKDGMGDWLPIREIPELYGAVASGGASPDQTAQEPSNAGGFPAPGGHGFDAAFQPPMAAASSNGNGATNGLYTATPAPAAARRQGGRGGGGADLFGGVAQAGGEDDVMTSAPAGMPQASADPGKLTGQRNENSVLFSLNALTSTAPKEEASPGPVEGSGLIDIRALSATMGNDGGGKKSGHVDDIMNLGGGGAFSAALAAPVLAPPTMDGGLDFGGGGARKDNTKILLIGIIGAGALIALAIVLVVLLKKPAEPTAPTALPTDTATGASPTAPPASAAVADNTPPPASAAAPAPPPAADNGGSGDSTGHKHHGGGGNGGGGHASTGGGAAAADNSPPAYVPPSAPAAPAGGGGSFMDQIKKAGGGGDAPAPPAAAQTTASFDRGAAAAALGSVSVGGCKKSDGPTGSGHIKITFAPSGSVQSAQVDTPPFAGTAVGGCVAGKFRSAHIPAFAGAPVTVGKSFTID